MLSRVFGKPGWSGLMIVEQPFGLKTGWTNEILILMSPNLGRFGRVSASFWMKIAANRVGSGVRPKAGFFRYCVFRMSSFLNSKPARSRLEDVNSRRGGF